MNETTQSWSAWLATWRVHARTREYKRRFERAVEIAQNGWTVCERRLFAAVSGGKDSLAMLAVLKAAGVDPLCVHAFCELNTPGMDTAATKACDALRFEWEVIEPDFDDGIDVFEFMRRLRTDLPIWDERVHVELRKRTASGNQLVAWMYAQEEPDRLPPFNGSFSGMRAEESKGRRANRRVRGALYQFESDRTWMCLPVVDWSGRDVWAAIVSHDLEPPPHYRLLLERYGISPESPASRVDSLLTRDTIAARGSWATARRLYPDLWRRIRDARPEVAALDGG